MRKDTGAVNYFIGNLLYNTFPMYVFGSTALTGYNFLQNLLRSDTVEEALAAALEYYVAKLTPFPLNEFLTANGFKEVVLNVSLATVIGLLWATYRWRTNV
ncbi:hypothetical protein RYH80_19910 [Halobaculum sp. MBLA0147]|uniref:hypothetical protein n=1 Tax=Halobaculum sp. MBLA0147 TaxID=3079934 RepID=UPI00352440B2